MISAHEYLRIYNSAFGDHIFKYKFSINLIAWVFSLFFRDSESDDIGSKHFDNLLNHDVAMIIMIIHDNPLSKWTFQIPKHLGNYT